MNVFQRILIYLMVAIGVVAGSLALAAMQGGGVTPMRIALFLLGCGLVLGGVGLGISTTSNPARWAFASLGAVGLLAAFLAIHHSELPAPARGIAVVAGCGLMVFAYPRLSPQPGKARLGCLLLLPVFLGIAVFTGGSGLGPFYNFIEHHSEIVRLSIVLPIAAIAYWAQRRSRSNLQALAGRLGFHLQFEEDASDRPEPVGEGKPRSLGLRAHWGWLSRARPVVTGRHRGRDVRFCLRKQKLWKGRVTCCAVVTPIKPEVKFILHLRPISPFMQPQLNRQPHLENELQPVEFEDEEFNLTFSVESNAPAAAKALLNPETRATLLATRPRPRREMSPERLERLARRPNLRRSLRYNPLLLDIENGELSLAFTGGYASPTKLDALASRLDLLCRLADQVEKA